MNLIKNLPGPFLVFLGAVSLSFGGLIVKSFEGSTLWQILFWRSFFFIIVISIFLLISYKKTVFSALYKSGFPGLVGGVILSIGFASYVFAMYETTVANANFIIQTQTLFLAIFGYVFLKEKISKLTLTCIIIAVFGILLMLGGSVSPGQMTGNLVAFIMPISFAILILIVRKFPEVDMIPLQLVAGIFATLIGLAMSPTIIISSNDIFLGFFSRFFPSWIWFYIYNNWCQINTISFCRNNNVNRSCIRTTLGLVICKRKSTNFCSDWRINSYNSSCNTIFE